MKGMRLLVICSRSGAPSILCSSFFKAFMIICAIVFIVPKAHSDGILIPVIPEPRVQIAIKYHNVDVRINNQIAITKVDQVFINQSPIQIEADYIFPLPKDVLVNEFIMYDEKGNPMKAEILDSSQARQIYEEIVRRQKDPAILEYVGTGAFRMRIFPILPWSEKRITLEYSEDLRLESGVCKYMYPLNTEKFSSRPLERVEVGVKIESQAPIKNVWSPSHEGNIEVVRPDDNHARIIYAEENVTPDKDFLLYYTVSYDEVGLSLLTYKARSEDGFYVFMAAPKYTISSERVISKNVLFVFDTSGSMATDNKIGQAKEALEFCIRNLNKQDNFNIIDFSTAVRKFKPGPVPAGADEIQSALQYIKDLNAIGGTNINDALLEALRQVSLAKNPLSMIIFLTDGQPTIGVRDEQKIVQNVKSANKTDTRVFVFGVGYDVNTRLLDELAIDNTGISAYVRPGEDIEIIVSDFFTKVSTPVLSNLSLDFGGINTVDRYPPELPDLFAGSQIKEFGRYRGSGNALIELKGMVADEVKEFTYEAHFPAENTENKFIPSIWAARKVGYLTEQVRRYGGTQELINEIRDLCIKYGIINNEYVSMLILEDEPPAPLEFERQFADSVGKGAVDASYAIQTSKNAEAVQTSSQRADLKVAGNKTFVKKGEFWIDAEHKDESPTIHLQYESNGYFNLLAIHHELGKYFALGKNVIVYYDGELYRIQESPVKTMKWDLDENGVVDIYDLVTVVIYFGKSGVPADVNEDGIVNILDLVLIVKYFGQKNADMQAAPAIESDKAKIKLTTRVVDSQALKKLEQRGNRGFTPRNEESLVVGIYADSLKDLFAFQLDLSFDPEVLEAVKVEEGTALSTDANATYWISPQVDNVTGKVTGAACIRMNTETPSDKDDALVYATFRLKNLDPERAENSIRIIDAKLSDPKAYPIAVVIGKAQDETRTSQLWQNYPNPFNPNTWIPYKLAEDSFVVIRIYDANGKLIRKLELGHKQAGVYAAKTRAAFWDGKNESGEEVSSGIYFYVLETDKFKSVKKMALRK